LAIHRDTNVAILAYTIFTDMGKRLWIYRSVYLTGLSIGLSIPSFAATVSGDGSNVIPPSFLHGVVLVSVVVLGITARQISRIR
jgi:hypothetical protein